MRVILLAAIFLLASCVSDNHQDLAAFIDEVNHKSAPKVVEVPIQKVYQPYTYDVASYRSPFQLSMTPLRKKSLPHKTDSLVKPDFNRAKQPLEAFSIEQLTMVGTLSQSTLRWALLMTGNGDIHKVTAGHIIGKNHGHIQAIDNDSITIKEIISNGQSTWTHRVRVLKIQDIQQ